MTWGANLLLYHWWPQYANMVNKKTIPSKMPPTTRRIACHVSSGLVAETVEDEKEVIISHWVLVDHSLTTKSVLMYNTSAYIASYPGLLTCSTNVREDISSVQLWGSFLNPRNVMKTAYCSVIVWSVVSICSALTYLWFFRECALLHTST